ncbi:MAG: hypothetical protein V4474_00170 [Patescibacteria group bacterium]
MKILSALFLLCIAMPAYAVGYDTPPTESWLKPSPMMPAIWLPPLLPLKYHTPSSLGKPDDGTGGEDDDDDDDGFGIEDA